MDGLLVGAERTQTIDGEIDASADPHAGMAEKPRLSVVAVIDAVRELF